MDIRSIATSLRNTSIGRSNGIAALTLLVLALVVAACDSSTDSAPSSVWKATLAGTDSVPQLTGTTEVSVFSRTIRAKLSVNKAGNQQTYNWRVARGTCADPKAIVGAAAEYGEIRTDTAGVASITVLVGTTLKVDSTYHVSVHKKNQANTLAACTALTKQ